ncbi:uncharacterized protein [Diadema antillarum]|uniref:uncharacterized protein n=1 Tax=Diadema antillarum TaxID=105358 RepID=UPI003A8AEE4C
MASCELLFVLLMSSIFAQLIGVLEVQAALPSIFMTDIPEDVKKGCVVVLLSGGNPQLRGVLDEIDQLFHTVQPPVASPAVWADDEADDPTDADRAGIAPLVKIGILDGQFIWEDSLPVKLVNEPDDTMSNHHGYSLVVFQQQKTDRKCLLPPPKVHFPEADIYFGPFSTPAVLEFINIKCNTYVSANGGISVEGIHRHHILENLFKVTGQSMGGIQFQKSRSQTCNNEMNDGVSSHIEEKYGADLKESCSSVCDLISDDGGSCHDASSCQTLGGQDILRNCPSKKVEEISQCERVSHLSKEDFFLRYLSQSRPVVIENGASQWPAFRKWSMESLKKWYGEEKVHIKLAPDGIFEGVEPAEVWEDHDKFEIPAAIADKLPYPDLVVVRPATQNVKFADFIEIIQNSSQPLSQTQDPKQRKPRVSAYLEYSSIRTYFPELEEDLEEPDFVRNLLDRRHLNIWLSDGDTLGKLHFDPFDNLLCQLRGRKELILFEPHNNTRLYEAHVPEALLGFDPVSRTFRRKKLMDSTSMVMSPVDVLKPNYQMFPAFADAQPLNCTINEGDILFMPAFWWHEVQSYPNEIERRNLAVNFWYEPFLTKEFPCPRCPLDINPHYRHLL